VDRHAPWRTFYWSHGANILLRFNMGSVLLRRRRATRTGMLCSHAKRSSSGTCRGPRSAPQAEHTTTPMWRASWYERYRCTCVTWVVLMALAVLRMCHTGAVDGTGGVTNVSRGWCLHAVASLHTGRPSKFWLKAGATFFTTCTSSQ
jgi:hypothetical protein